MVERAFVHVAGTPGCGKTTFVESLLSTAGGFIFAARCVRNDTLPTARETAPMTHPELRRYREAGASGVALYEFPKRDLGTDAFFATRLMQDYSQGVVLEGGNPLQFADFAVFVAPPPATGQRLFVRRPVDQARLQLERIEAIERLLEKPGGGAEFFGGILGSTIGRFAQERPALFEEAGAELLAGMAAARKAPQPKSTQRWAIADMYSGIELAQLVVVNVRNDFERAGAEELVADLLRIRKEEELFNDILRLRGKRIPITAVVANLTQPADPGRKKALARVRRALSPKT